MHKLTAYGMNLVLMVIRDLMEDWYANDPNSLVSFLSDRERFRSMLDQGYPRLLSDAKGYISQNLPSSFRESAALTGS